MTERASIVSRIALGLALLCPALVFAFVSHRVDSFWRGDDFFALFAIVCLTEVIATVVAAVAWARAKHLHAARSLLIAKIAFGIALLVAILSALAAIVAFMLLLALSFN